MKNKTLRVVLSIFVMTGSILSAALGFGLLGEASLSFPAKFAIGFVFMATPILLVQLIILLFRKDK